MSATDHDVDFIQYTLVKPGVHNSYQLFDHDGKPAFWVRNSHFSMGDPDLIVHDGADESKPVLAAAEIHKALRFVRVALGNDGKRDDDIEKFTAWTPVKKNDPHTPWSHAFGMPASRDTVGGYRHPYIWKKQKRPEELAIKGIKKSIRRNYVLTDANSGELVAVLARTGGWSKKGTFHIQESMNKEQQVIIMLTAISLLEKRKRGWVYFWHQNGYGPYGVSPGGLLLLAAGEI